MFMDNKEDKRIDKENDAINNTISANFEKLGKAIRELGCSIDDVIKVSNYLGKAFNHVPPYTHHRKIKSKIFLYDIFIKALFILFYFSLFIYFFFL